jgi:hypothetical protein
MKAAGTGTARDFRPALPDEVKHLLDTHLSIFFGKENGEVYIAYSLNCGDKPCPLPVRPLEASTPPDSSVTFRICPTRPCGP